MNLEKGKTYRVKLASGAWTDAEFLSEATYGGFKTIAGAFAPERHIRKRTTYHFRNLRTSRVITLRSLRKVKECQ